MRRGVGLVFAACLAACAGKSAGAGDTCAPVPPVEHAAEPAPPRVSRSAIQRPAPEIAYRAAPPNMPPGVQMAVLEGDPRADGLFTLRLKAPPGFALPPHTHPTDERVTVLEGAISVGFGATVDRSVAKSFGAGSFYVNPPGVAHFVFSDEGATVQITGQGPWRVDVVAVH